MSDAKAPAPARRGVWPAGSFGSVGGGIRGHRPDTRADFDAVDRDPADWDVAQYGAGRLYGPDADARSWSDARAAFTYGYYSYVQTYVPANGRFDTNAQPHANSEANGELSPDYHCIPAADAGSHPDAGSDSRASRDLPGLRQRRGQRRRNRDDLRDFDRPGLGDGSRVPRRRGSSDGSLHDDHLQRAGDVGRSLQRDGQRRGSDIALLRHRSRVWRRLGVIVRWDGRRRDAGRADLYVVGVEQRDGEHLQRISERRRGVGDLPGGLT